jgi:uncharacterized membrane protein YdbT with pleckstrin-like domain
MNKPIKAGSIYLPKADSDRNFIKYSQKKTEEILFLLHPSMLRYLGVCIFCALTFWAVIPVFIYIFLYHYNKSTKYIITNERIRIIRGLLVRKVIDLELYRVKDISQSVPFYLKIIGLGSLELVTSDPSNPYITLEAITEIDQLEETIRYHVERRRDEKKVQEIDQYRYEKTS